MLMLITYFLPHILTYEEEEEEEEEFIFHIITNNMQCNYYKLI